MMKSLLCKLSVSFLFPNRSIKADAVDINSSNEVAKNFRNYLYNGLEFLLKNDRLKDADLRTTEIMFYIAGKHENRYFNEESLTNFSCGALQEIDKHWYDYPKYPHKFGFRVQKGIWQRNASTMLDSPIEMWSKFYREVISMTYDENMDAELSERKEGTLPNAVIRGIYLSAGRDGDERKKRVTGPEEVLIFFSRVANCKL